MQNTDTIGIKNNTSHLFNSLSINKCNIIKYLISLCPTIMDVELKSSISIFWGFVQSGKTYAIQCYILLCIILGFNVIILFHDDLSHPYQFNIRFTVFLDSIVLYGRTHNKFVLIKPSIVDNKNNNEDIINSLKCGNTIIYSNNNKTQLTKFKFCLEQSNKKYTIIQDESDISAKKNKESKRDILRLDILEKSFHILCCTATPYAHFFEDKFNIQANQFIHIKPSSKYKGWEYCNKISIGEDIQDVTNYCILPDWMYFSISHFEQNCRKSIKDNSDIRDPNILIIKITSIIKKHYSIQDILKTEYPNNPSIVYSGDYIRIFIQNFNTTKRHEYKKDYYIFFNISLMEILSMIYEHLKSINSSQTVFIIGGRRLDRGLSITSIDHNFYANGEIYIKSKLCRFSTMDQAMRVYGISNDSDPRFIYSTTKIFEEMKLGYDVINATYETSNIKNCLMTSVIQKNNIPHKLRKIIMSPTFNLIDQIEKTPLNTTINIEEFNEIEWGKKNLTKNIKNALKRGDETIVIKIIKYMKLNTESSIENIVSNCNITVFTHYTEWKKKNTKYKILIKKSDNLYKINPEIEDIIKII